MEQAPVTDRRIGVDVQDEKFREVRNRAVKAQDRHRKAKRNKRGREWPCNVGDTVAIKPSHGDQGRFYAVEIVDYEIGLGMLSFFGIVKKASFNSDRIGRLIKFHATPYLMGWSLANVPVESVKWERGIET